MTVVGSKSSVKIKAKNCVIDFTFEVNKKTGNLFDREIRYFLAISHEPPATSLELFIV